MGRLSTTECTYLPTLLVSASSREHGHPQGIAFLPFSSSVQTSALCCTKLSRANNSIHSFIHARITVARSQQKKKKTKKKTHSQKK